MSALARLPSAISAVPRLPSTTLPPVTAVAARSFALTLLFLIERELTLSFGAALTGNALVVVEILEQALVAGRDAFGDLARPLVEGAADRLDRHLAFLLGKILDKPRVAGGHALADR